MLTLSRPMWNGDADKGNDIAILKTNENWPHVVELASIADFEILSEDSSEFVVYGFGWTDSAGSVSPPILQKSEALSFWRCDQAWFYEKEDSWYDLSLGSNGKRDFSKTICFDGSNGSDMCPGDSGGPLMIKADATIDVSKPVKQYGINSYIFGSCGSMPSVDTSVAHYLNWIETNSNFTSNVRTCTSLNCSHACYLDGNSSPKCACPEGFLIDTESEGRNSCEEISEKYISKSLIWSSTMIQPDNTIRPFSDQEKCFYHKMNGFTDEELIFVGDCFEHDRFRWSYNETTGLIENFNRRWVNPHCISIKDPTNTRQKQALSLKPCDASSSSQQWTIEFGKIKPRASGLVCVMWNLSSGSRLWAQRCGENHFSKFVV